MPKRSVPAAHDLITIGELARRSGVAASALRFYEESGLIASVRTEANHRRYRRATLRTVSIIRVAQGLGLSLGEIGRALAGAGGDVPTAADWGRMADEWKGQLDARIAQLTALRDDLTECIGCGCLSLGNCALYNRLDKANTRGPGPRFLLGDRSSSIPELGG